MCSPLVILVLLGVLWTPVTTLICPEISPSPSAPHTVNSVRPSDVAVLSSIGLHRHSSELSSVASRLQELMTLFNPALTSPSLHKTNLYSDEFVQPRTLVEQAEELSLYLHSDQAADMEGEWKLVLLFVQVDQLCVFEDHQIEPAVSSALREVERALQLLHSELKHAIVSVAVWDGEYDAYHHNRMCPCMETNSEGELRLLRPVLIQVLQESLDDHLVKKKWYGDRDDFTVILQDTPFITDPASMASGSAPSESQARRQIDNMLVQMWANLLQPAREEHNTQNNDVVLTVPCPSENRPFLRTEGNSPSYRHSDASPLVHPITGTVLPCVDLQPSNSTPTSVHALRPGDVKVVAAVGDSLTAGNGIASNPNDVIDVLRQYRGLSWSIGGDENLTTVTTLPNILKHFNPRLTGYSEGMGKEHTPQSFLNQAVAGQRSRDMPAQVRALVKRMKNDSRISFESDWKVITVFIGGNDMCDFCFNSLYFSAENYVRHIRDALDYLHKEVPRAFVNLVEPLYITPLREMHVDPSLKCPTWLVNIICPCVISPKAGSRALHLVEEMNRGYQRSINELVNSGRYDTRSDFTVVTQPFFRDIFVPKLQDGRPDRSFFSADCFHLSQRAQTIMARSLWNNMLEPLGFKTTKENFTSQVALKCPSKTLPYIRTYLNSNYTYEGPSPTPGPVKNWGSDFSCVDLAPSVSVPTSAHKLRPGDIKVVAALGDSHTAGTGAKAKNLFQLKTEYRGVSWSIGGDGTLDTVTTLPNILKKFNPSLQGFSKGQISRQKGFNMAVSGAKILEIPAQVKALIKAMRENKKVDFEKDWKLVTVFVGGNDLCSYCTDQNNLSPKNYSANLMLSLDILYEEVPRVLVNVVEIGQIDPLRTIKKNSLGCTLLQRFVCPCLMHAEENSPELEELKRINQLYQMETQRLISGGRYDGRVDFTVVLQPYLRNLFVPYIGEGVADVSFFSLDCFHISERTHAEMAIGLWNNMLEPEDRKQVYNNFTYDRSKIRCPSEAHPFIFTKINSLPSPPVSITTAAPELHSTSSSSPLPTLPAPKCPSALPVWVPVVAAISSLLVGIAAAWLFLSRRQIKEKKKKNEDRTFETKAAGF
ncbi:phospholipase B1, membrane-associated-like [Lampris incognitus]|uniref:phospholipase B1, membrane-associated-like n=1 Tax=Lampris incognitus TaxID=2546036 RepID=UPI0024B55189|nr:phospholipase B1, membrane-associated-like [Lampris incognitus]